MQNKLFQGCSGLFIFPSILRVLEEKHDISSEHQNILSLKKSLAHNLKDSLRPGEKQTHIACFFFMIRVQEYGKRCTDACLTC